MRLGEVLSVGAQLELLTRRLAFGIRSTAGDGCSAAAFGVLGAVVEGDLVAVGVGEGERAICICA